MHMRSEPHVHTSCKVSKVGSPASARNVAGAQAAPCACGDGVQQGVVPPLGLHGRKRQAAGAAWQVHGRQQPLHQHACAVGEARAAGRGSQGWRCPGRGGRVHAELHARQVQGPQVCAAAGGREELGLTRSRRMMHGVCGGAERNG
eukprot:350320-Chlamydomonas_euryale.AAC.4